MALQRAGQWWLRGRGVGVAVAAGLLGAELVGGGSGWDHLARVAVYGLATLATIVGASFLDASTFGIVGPRAARA